MRRMTIGLAALLTLAACGGSESESAGGAQDDQEGIPACAEADEGTVVVALDNAWEPECLTVSPGQDLTVRNDGNAAHTFTLPEADVQLVLQPGDEAVAEGVGDAPGPGEQLEFICDFHPEMVGIVQGAES